MMQEQIKLRNDGIWTNLKAGRLLEELRKRPPLFIGEYSLSALYNFLDGYSLALRLHDIERPNLLPPDFHDWVAYRLHFRESTTGYRNMILKHTSNEREALDRFFELLDEHRQRVPTIVAELSDYQAEYKKDVYFNGKQLDGRVVRFPGTIHLITYTDDPGFFVTSAGGGKDMFPGRGFCPSLESFRIRFKADIDNLTVRHAEIFSRLVAEG